MKNSPESKERSERSRAAGAAFGRGFAALGSGFGDEGPVGYDEWEAAQKRKAEAQAKERKRFGLAPSDYVAEGLKGEPKVDDD
jgi:hypothetical protein